MPSPTTLAVFSLAALALLALPGPAVLYVVGQSLANGRRAGLVSVLGIETGGLVHVLAATIGLSALLASSAQAFTIVKYAGATYLALLGLQRLLGRSEPDGPDGTGDCELRPLYLQGVVVNVLNPKVALFFLAFLPQFVRPGHGPAALQILVLGMLFLLLALVNDGVYAFLAGSVGAKLTDRRRRWSLSRYGSGGLLIGLGVAAAFSGRSSA
jgi:threonine/homoserine/homoserine lactone efflux protein